MQTGRDPTAYGAVDGAYLQYEYHAVANSTLSVYVGSSEVANYGSTRSSVFAESVRTLRFSNTTYEEAPASTLIYAGPLVAQSGNTYVSMTPIATQYPQFVIYGGIEPYTPVGRLKLHNITLTTRPFSGRRRGNY
jgi:hypothetical protein